MRTFPACVPCILGLTERTLANSDLDQIQQDKILDEIRDGFSSSDLAFPPARNAGLIYQKILQASSQDDLFLTHKQAAIQEALKLYPRLKQLVEDTRDPLDAALRVSALGNILDIANPSSYTLADEISRLLEYKVWGDSLETFRERLSRSASLLILADNAGETVFDRVLIETLDIPVLYAVKSSPAFDDALLEDARQSGIEQYAQIIETGTPYPGTYLPSCSPEFREIFANAPLILAKGQANFETLNDIGRDLFFLLKVKCEVVSDVIGIPLGSLTLKYQS